MKSNERAKKCWEEIQKLLVKFNCVLVAQPTFTQEGRVQAVINIVPRPDGETE